jgi:NhaP-type Na+/H+ or K+/H+ antiporter
MRGGLELQFKDINLTVALLTLVPQIVEAVVVAVLSRALFSLPWPLCFANGFCLGAVSPAVLVPSIMILIQEKRGTK